MKDNVSELPLEDELNELNAKYCVVKIGEKVRVLSFRKEMGRSVPEYMAFGDFKNFLLNRSMQVGNKRIDLGSWRLTHPQRRTYNGVVYLPGKEVVRVVDGNLNLWQGFSVTPKKGDWSLMLQHIKEILGDGEEKKIDYIINWMAWMFQNPGTQAEVGLVMKGGQGTGRGTFGRTLRMMFGQHGLQISSAGQMTGRFNAHLQDLSYLYVNEAIWPGNKEAEATWKRIHTDDDLTIEMKFGATYSVKNCLHIFTDSNNGWSIPADMDSRRSIVMDVSEKHKQDAEWFGPLYKQMDNGGRGAMLYDLLHRDLKDWHPRRIIQTIELYDQKLRSLSSDMSWWLDVLMEGRLPFGRDENANECPTEALHEHYIEHARKSGDRYPRNATLFGIFLFRDAVGPALIKLKDRKYKIVQKGHLFERSGNAYQFPTLKECRARVDALMSREQGKWSDPEADWVAIDQKEIL